MKHQIKYTDGFKAQLAETYRIQTGIKPTCHLSSSGGFAQLGIDGVLIICKGFAWDFASGPAIDTNTIKRGSLVHDALYCLIAEGKLNPMYRKDADELLYRICREDGMNAIRAWWVYRAVRKCGGIAMQKRVVKTAP